MPNVTFDGQSFSVRGRRIWLCGAEFEYALVSRDAWRARLASLKRLGVNMVVASAPWSLHEPRPGRFEFEGALDVKAFAQTCAELELWLVLKIGPAVGGTFDGSGLPAWVSDLPEVRIREDSPVFTARVIQWYRALGERVVKLQASEPTPLRGAKARNPAAREVGPLLAVQIEDDWACYAPQRATNYLGELQRYALEVGFAVPLFTNNRSWTHSERAIDLWTGWSELPSAMRQLAHIEPAKPRVAVVRDPASLRIEGDRAAGKSPSTAQAAREVARRLGAVLANGGQFVIAGAMPTIHAGPSAGSIAVGEGPRGPLASVSTDGLLVGVDGAVAETSGSIRRIVAFAGAFGHVLSQIDASRQQVVADPDATGMPSVIPLQGPAGTAVFVFAAKESSATLLLSDGRRLDVSLGAEPVSWFLFDADLLGAGVLDYATVSPFAFIGRKQLVFFGPAGTTATISLGGVPASMRVPAKGAARPTIDSLGGLTVILCNEEQIDRALATPEGLVLGAERFDDEGSPVRAPGAKSVVRVNLLGKVETLPATERATTKAIPLQDWSMASAGEFVDGSSPRYATLDGPASLSACGAREGYGWYRLQFRRASSGTVLVHAPQVADRALFWLDGTFLGAFGNGLAAGGARSFPIELKLTKGEHRLVMLVEAVGRPTAGDHVGRRTGAYGPLFEVKPLRSTPKRIEGPIVDPFRVRGFIYGVGEGDRSEGIALAWRVDHRKRAPILFDPGRNPLPGTVVLNGTPVARIGVDGPEDGALILDPDRLEGFRSGPNDLHYVFDGEPEDRAIAAIAKSARLFEAAPAFGQPQWGFATWSPPRDWRDLRAVAAKEGPTWFRTAFTWSGPPRALRLDPGSLLRGRAFVNGEPIGRHAFRGELPVSPSLLLEGRNELLLFDESGGSPKGVALRAGG